MTIDEAIKHLKQYIDNAYYTEKHQRACVMAITALCAQQTPAKLDRSRWEGCPCCEGKVAKNKDDNYIPTQRYCDICGRPLTELAWVELERRISGGTTD